MSLYGVIYRGAPAIGALCMGAAAELVGIRWGVALGGILSIVIWFWMLGRSKTASISLEKTS